MCAYITSIGTANPKYKIKQSEVVQFMIKAHHLNEEEAKDLKILYRATGIQERYSSIEDYSKLSGFNFFPNDTSLEPFPKTSAREKWYKEEALPLSILAIEECIDNKIDRSDVTHLITVSCTGMYAPGLDIDIVNQLSLPTSVERTCINFMGCYAAFNALKAAHYICNTNSDANVLIVCTELCSLHFQKAKTKDNLLANAIFGDGSGAMLVQAEPTASISFKLESFLCELLPQGKNEMAWAIGDHGYEMKLSAYVPDAIAHGIAPVINALRKKIHRTDFDYYAIHPGGKKILDIMEKYLGITKADNIFSHKVLKQYGNMSSATVIFVLKAIRDQIDKRDHGKYLLSFAFGPGLTLESLIASVYVK